MEPATLFELSRSEFDSETENIERLIDQTPEIDPWCSCPDWVLSTHHAFASVVDPLLLTDSDRSGYAMLAHYVNDNGDPIVTSLEPMWGFASPIITPEPARFAKMLVSYLQNRDDWTVLALPGLPLPTDQESFTVGLLRSLSVLGEARAGEGITRQIADISPESGGFDGWFQRRSPKFRKNLRQVQSNAADSGVSIIDATHDDYVFDRVLEIENQSWKGLEDSGITSAEMRALYSLLTIRLEEKHRLEVHIAQRDGSDIGYILGGRRGGLYRGLQLSYTADAKDLSIGHLLQLHQIEKLTGDSQNPTTRYDLGMDIEYKRRWSDSAETSIMIVLERRQ